MTYLLDTNAWIGVLSGRVPAIMEKLEQFKPEQIGMSSIVLHELYFGAYRSKHVTRNLEDVDRLLFLVVEYGREDARMAGEIRAHLASTGSTIGHYDILIAGQARARDLTLVTHNMREFSRVPGLSVEDWEQG